MPSRQNDYQKRYDEKLKRQGAIHLKADLAPNLARRFELGRGSDKTRAEFAREAIEFYLNHLGIVEQDDLFNEAAKKGSH